MAKSKTIKVVDVVSTQEAQDQREPEMNEGAIQSEINNHLQIIKDMNLITDPEQMKHLEIIKDIGSIAEPIVDVKLPKDANGAKAKRQPKAKKVEPIVEPEVTVESTLNESVVELKIPEELIKQIKVQADKVKCPDCEKMVSSKSLKYSHKHTCIAKKVKEHNDKTKKDILLNNDDVIDNKETQDDQMEKVYEPVEVALPIKQNVSVKETARDMRQRLRQERLLNLFVNAV